MGGGVSRHALKLAGGVDQGFDLLVVLVKAAQLPAQGQRALQRHPQFKRHQLCDLVGLLEAEPQHAAHIANRRARGHRAEGDDLRHMIAAVAAAHIGDHLAAALIVEIDVYIGHRYALRVQKALEQKLVFDRIDGRDAERVGDDRAGAAAAPGADADAVFLGIADEIPDDQKVIDIAHRADHIKFVVKARARVLAIRAVALQKALAAKLFEVLRRVRLVLWQREFRQVGG